MKKFLILSILLLILRFGQAQTFDEWFKQKETQRKYLQQQITAFQVYLGYVQKGYAIAREGLTVIGNIKKGDFTLHGDYFNALKAVNPTIRSYTKVAEAIALELRIVSVSKAVVKTIGRNGSFDVEMAGYLLAVLENLLKDCGATTAELTAVITPNELQMNDAERLTRIDGIYNQMQGNFTFIGKLATAVSLLALQQKKAAADIAASREQHDLKSNAP